MINFQTGLPNITIFIKKINGTKTCSVPLIKICRYLLELSEDVAEVDLLRDDCVKVLDLNALLLHAVAVTDSYAAVVK